MRLALRRSMLDLLIIGGGIHGTALSHILIRSRAVQFDRIRVLDPHARPLAVWKRTTSQCGMRFLRSPGAHTIDGSFTSLKPGGTEDSIPPNRRPSLELFNRHADGIIDKFNLDKLRIRGTATILRPSREKVTVETDNGSIDTSRVLICVGRSSSPFTPPAFAGLPEDRCVHVYSPRFSRPEAATRRRITIIGGGIAAAQLAAALARARTADLPPVAVISPHQPIIAQYDSDPCYIGPRCAHRFLAQNTAGRRTIISAARKPDTMPQDVYDEFRAAIRRKTITFAVDPRLLDATSHDQIIDAKNTDLFILATGFQSGPPLPKLVANLSREHSLPVDSCGFPVVDQYLRWNDRIHLAGPLGELELGPAAGNIIGAHLAARRLVPFFVAEDLPPRPWKPLTRWWPN